MTRTTPAIGRRRLATLATFLEHLRPTRRRRYDRGAFWKEEKRNNHVCRTAGCALGWATTIPSFRRAGLRLGRLGGPMNPVRDPGPSVRYASVRYGQSEDSDAAVRFFAIPFFAALDFFSGDARGPRDVARRIRTYLARTAA